MADEVAQARPRPRLPLEVSEGIFVMAARADQQTACALALVSREVCSITTEARSSTAVLRTMRSAQLFFSAIWHSPEMLSVARRRFPDSAVAAMMESLGGEPLLSRTRRPKEWSTMPRMDHLYIEMRDFDLRQWDAFWNTLAECYSTLFGSCQGSLDEDAVAISKHVDLFAQDLSLGLEESKYHAPKPVMDLPGSSYSSSQPCRLSSRNLTIVIDYSDTDEHAILSDWVLCDPLERLHVVGCASQSEEAGYTPEFDVFTSTRAGAADSIATQDISYSSKGQWSGVPKLTHIRWDTRRFAFQPIEITVRRLAPLLREICFADNSRRGDNTTTACNFTYSGPRHAAPSHGSGRSNGVIDAGDATSVWDEETEDAKMLRKAGVGRFRRLEFAWDLPPKLLDAQLQANSDAAAGEQQRGGWPRESHDVWTQRNMHGRAQTFRSEFLETVTDAYGWAPSGASRKPSREEAKSWLGQYRFVAPGAGHMVDEVASERGSLGEYQHVLDFIEEQMSLHDQQRASEHNREQSTRIGRKLKYAMRAPSTVFKLGQSTAALDSETRLALFLDRAQGGPGSWA